MLLLFVDTAAGPRYPLALRPGSVPRSPPVPSTPVPPAPSTRVGPGVLLASPNSAVRYKTLPAQLLGGDNGTKLSLHIEKAPNRAISGEQGEFSTGSGAVRLVLGEFCTAHAVGRGVLGEFCTGSGAVRLVLGEFCTEGVRRGCCWANSVVPWRRPRASWRAMAVPRCSRAPWPALAALFVLGLWCWRVLSRQPAVWCPPAPSTLGSSGGCNGSW